LPSQCRPSTNTSTSIISGADNGASVLVAANVATSGTITFGKSVSGGAWTASGTKGVDRGVIMIPRT
jgi:hypothetical protein